MTITPAGQAPFAIGAAVRFLPDPDYVEYVVEVSVRSEPACEVWSGGLR
jgi:hypothetical protein